MEYQDSHRTAEQNRSRMLEALPKQLSKQEDQFLIKIKKVKAGPLVKLGILYSFMDEVLKFTSQFMSCKNGCSACCHYKINLSPIEVEYIEKNTLIHRSINIAPGRNFHGEPCPFLKNNSCSIYEVRPFVCRKHHAFTSDAYWCEPTRSNNVQFPLIKFTNIDEAFEVIKSEGKAEILFDIRQFFG
jgi:uncharacterized protein